MVDRRNMPVEDLIPGGGLSILTDRDQQSWVFLNDPKKYFTNDRRPKKILFEKQDSKKYPRQTGFVWSMLSTICNKEELCSLKYLMTKTGHQKYCLKYKTLRNTTFI